MSELDEQAVEAAARALAIARGVPHAAGIPLPLSYDYGWYREAASVVLVAYFGALDGASVGKAKPRGKAKG